MSDAKITVSANADAATRAAAVVKAAWVESGAAIASAIGSAAQRMVGDLASVATAQGQVNFSAQHAQVREFEAASARMAVSMGQDLNVVRASLNATGLEIGKRPQEVALWAAEVGKLTYSYDGAVQAQKGLAGLAALTGRSVGEYKNLAVELATVGKVGGDTTKEIGSLVGMSEKLGNAGGIPAFIDQVTNLSDAIAQLGTKGPEDFNKVIAATATLGKGLSPQMAGRVQQDFLGRIASDPMRINRIVGHDVMDEHGQVKADEIPAIMRKVYEDALRRAGGDRKQARYVLRQGQNFGNVLGSQIANAYEAGELTDEKINALATTKPSGKAAEALKTYQATDAGKREGAEAALAVSSSALLGSSTLLGRAADALQQAAAHNPITTTLVTSALTAGSATFAASFGAKLQNMMGSGGGGAVGGAVRLAGGLTNTIGGVAALGAGYLAGTYLDEKYGLSDKASKAMVADSLEQRSADAENAKHRETLTSKRSARDAKVAELVAAGMTRGQALFAADHPEAGGAGGAGGAGAPKAEAMDPVALAKAFAEVMKGVEFKVVTRADTPIEVTSDGEASESSGNQGE